MEATPEAMAMVDTDTDTARDLPMLSPKPMLTTTVLAILMPTPDMPLPTTDTALSDMLTISSERDLLMLSPKLMPRLDTDMDTAEAMVDTPEAMAMVDTDTDTARDLPMLSPKPMLTTTVL